MTTAKNTLSAVVKYIIFIIWGSIAVIGFTWIILSSFKSNQELFSNIWGLPEKLRYENYIRAWIVGRIGIYFINSVIYVLISVTILVIFGSMASYAFTRPDNKKWMGFIFLLVLFGLSIPVQLSIIPLYINFMNFGLINTRTGLVLAHCSAYMPFTVFVLSGFFRTIPHEMEDAAEIEGCSNWQIYWKIVMPMAQAGLITIIIFSVLTIWNEYFFAMILITKESKMPLSAGLFNLKNQQRIAQDWTALLAGVVILFIPTLIMFLFLQNKISEGLTVGALKG
jgi:ABC-type glycerol-3-phosphate transport system permease component